MKTPPDETFTNEQWREKAKSLKKELTRLKHEQVAQYRGIVIHQMVKIEGYVNTVLCAYFCSTRQKRNEMMHILFSRESIGLKVKHELLLFILKNHYPKFFNKYPDFIEAFERLINLRNDCAHLDFKDKIEIESDQSISYIIERLRTKDSKIKPPKITKLNQNGVEVVKDFREVINGLLAMHLVMGLELPAALSKAVRL